MISRFTARNVSLPLLVAYFLVEACLPGIALSQDTSATEQAAACELDQSAYETIDSITAAVYAAISGPAGERRDWDCFRTLFAPGARLIPLNQRPTGPTVSPLTVDDYINMVDNFFMKNGFFEVEIARTGEQYGSIAHHFSTYESRRNVDDPEPFARGINSFQLVHDGDRWWIVTIFWQGETPAVPIPDRYLN